MRRIWILCLVFISMSAAAGLAATRAHPHRPAAKHKPTPTHGPRRQFTFLFGDRKVERHAGSSRGGTAESFPVSNTINGKAHALDVFVGLHNHARTLIVGLYANQQGRPGSLLASGARSGLKRGSWNTVALHPRIKRFRSRAVHAGTTYWIAVLGRHGALSVRDGVRRGCFSVTSARTSLAAMPASWKIGQKRRTCPLSAYVTGARVPRATQPVHGGPGGSAPTSPGAGSSPGGPPPIVCNLNATPSTFSSQVATATTGQTVCLASGNYGTWSGTSKAITIAPAPDASPTMSFDLGSGAANFTINGGHTNFDSNSPGINMGASYFESGSQNITVEFTAATTDGASFRVRRAHRRARDPDQGQHLSRHGVPELDPWCGPRAIAGQQHPGVERGGAEQPVPRYGC